MKFLATINYQGVSDAIPVEDCEHGRLWGRTRAISHFLHKHPELRPVGALASHSFKQVAKMALDDGLQITLEAAQ